MKEVAGVQAAARGGGEDAGGAAAASFSQGGKMNAAAGGGAPGRGGGGGKSVRPVPSVPPRALSPVGLLPLAGDDAEVAGAARKGKDAEAPAVIDWATGGGAAVRMGAEARGVGGGPEPDARNLEPARGGRGGRAAGAGGAMQDAGQGDGWQEGAGVQGGETHPTRGEGSARGGPLGTGLVHSTNAPQGGGGVDAGPPCETDAAAASERQADNEGGPRAWCGRSSSSTTPLGAAAGPERQAAGGRQEDDCVICLERERTHLV